MKIITDKNGNVKSTKDKNGNVKSTKENLSNKEIEINDSLKNKNPLKYKVIKRENSIMITPKSKIDMRKSFKNQLKNSNNVEKKLELVLDYLELNY
jgi:hypothetical protein